MAKDRAANPALAHQKAEKQKAIKKQKTQIQQQRDARNATRNPRHLQNQIDTLKEEKEAGGKWTGPQQKRLETLERELEAVKKARAKTSAPTDLPPKREWSNREGAPNRGAGRDRDRGVKRRWGQDGEESDVPTDEDVRRITMPRDTPPPIPSSRQRQARHNPRDGQQSGQAGGEGPRQPHALPARPPVAAAPAPKVYEAKPVLRDLRKEATGAKFMPEAVRRRKAEEEKERHRLKEPEEVDEIERQRSEMAAGKEQDEDDQEEEVRRFEAEVKAEEERFQLEQERRHKESRRQAMVEEVSDEDG